MLSTIGMGILYLLGSLLCGFIGIRSIMHLVVTLWTPENVTMEVGISIIAAATSVGCVYWLIMAGALLLP